MNYIIFVILYLILAVIFDQSYRIVAKSLTKSGPLTVILELIGAGSILLLSPFFKITFPTDIRVYILLGLSIIFYTIVDRLNTIVRSGMEASTFSVIRQLSTAFMIFAGFIFFKEPFIISKFVGAILIILSNILVFYKKGTVKIDKYVVLGILANLFFTIALFLDVNISNNFNLAFYVAITLGIPSILIFIFEKIKISDLKTEFRNGNKKMMIITAISWSTSIMATLKAYELGPASVVAPLCALAVILNVLFGYIFLKERKDVKKKVLASLFIILGVLLIQI